MDDERAGALLSAVLESAGPCTLEQLCCVTGIRKVPVAMVKEALAKLCSIGIIAELQDGVYIAAELKDKYSGYADDRVSLRHCQSMPEGAVGAEAQAPAALRQSHSMPERPTQPLPYGLVPTGHHPPAQSSINSQALVQRSQRMEVVPLQQNHDCDSSQVLQVTDRIGRIMAVLHTAPGPLHASKVAQQSGLGQAKSAINRELYALKERGFLACDSAANWSLVRPVSAEELRVCAASLARKPAGKKVSGAAGGQVTLTGGQGSSQGPPTEDCPCPNKGTSCHHYHQHQTINYHNTNVQVGDNNNLFFADNDAGKDGRTVVDRVLEDGQTVEDGMPANNNLVAVVETLMERTKAMEKKFDAIQGIEKIDKMLGVMERLEKFGAVERLEKKMVTFDRVVEKYGAIERLEEKLVAYDRLENKYGAMERLDEKLVAYDRLENKYGAMERLEEKCGAIEKLEEKLVAFDRLAEKYSAIERQVEQYDTIMKLGNSGATERFEEKNSIIERLEERFHFNEKQKKFGTNERSSFDPIRRPEKFAIKRPIKFDPIKKTAKFRAMEKSTRLYPNEKPVTFDAIKRLENDVIDIDRELKIKHAAIYELVTDHAIKRLEMNVTNIDRELKRIQAAIYRPVNGEDDRLSRRENSVSAQRLQTDGMTGDTA